MSSNLTLAGRYDKSRSSSRSSSLLRTGSLRSPPGGPTTPESTSASTRRVGGFLSSRTPSTPGGSQTSGSFSTSRSSYQQLSDSPCSPVVREIRMVSNDYHQRSLPPLTTPLNNHHEENHVFDHCSQDDDLVDQEFDDTGSNQEGEDTNHELDATNDKNIQLMKKAYAIAPPQDMNQSAMDDIRKITNKYICSKVKFLKHEHLYGGSKVVQDKLKKFPSFWEPNVLEKNCMAYDILSKCHGFDTMSVWNLVRFWKAIREKVLATIRTHRNVVQTKMQKAIVPGLIELNRIDSEDNRNIDNPSKLIRGLRVLRNLVQEKSDHSNVVSIRNGDGDLFRAFVDFSLMHTVGAIEWKGLKTESVVSNVFSVHDEAFAMLVMMNSWDEWEDRAKGIKIDKKNSKTLYTMSSTEGGNEEGHSETNQMRGVGGARLKKNNKVVRGWNKAGMMMFNKLVRHVYEVRKNQDQINKEAVLKQEYMKEMNDGEEKRSRKRKAEEELELIEVDGDDVVFDAYNFKG